MTLAALILFGVAIALWRHSHTQTDEVSKVLELAGALLGLMIGLVLSPLPLKVLSLTALLVYPACTSGDRVLKPECPRLCLLRGQCRLYR